MRRTRPINKHQGFPENLIKTTLKSKNDMTFLPTYSPTKVKCQWHEGCGNEFFKFRSTDKFCPAHRYMSIKLNKVQQKGRKQPKTPIKKVSDKRAIQNKEYIKLRDKFLKEHPQCQVYPYLKATECHHTYSGSNRNRYFLEVSTWMAVSREGHNFIHNNVKLSKERGWLK